MLRRIRLPPRQRLVDIDVERDCAHAQPLPLEPEQVDAPGEYDNENYCLAQEEAGAAQPWSLEAALHQTRLHANGSDWLHFQLKQPCYEHAVRVLEVMENGSLLILVPVHDVGSLTFGTDAVPKSHAQQQSARMNPFCEVHIRLLAFSGSVRFCCHCSNPGCPRAPSVRELFANELCKQLHIGQSYDALFGAEPSLCLCAEAAIQRLWGSVGNINEATDMIALIEPQLDTEHYTMARYYMEADQYSAVYCFVKTAWYRL